MKKNQLRNMIKECIQEALSSEKIFIDDLSFTEGMSVEGVSSGVASYIRDDAYLEAHKEKVKKAFGDDIYFDEWDANRFSIVDHPLEQSTRNIMQRDYYNSSNRYTGD